jgi:hypothetical protein
VVGFVTGLNLNLAEREIISSNHDESNYEWQQMLNGQYMKMRLNGVSMICGLVDKVIVQ